MSDIVPGWPEPEDDLPSAEPEGQIAAVIDALANVFILLVILVWAYGLVWSFCWFGREIERAIRGAFGL